MNNIKCESIKDFISCHTAEEISDMEFVVADMSEISVMNSRETMSIATALEMAADPECVVIYKEEAQTDVIQSE